MNVEKRTTRSAGGNIVRRLGLAELRRPAGVHVIQEWSPEGEERRQKEGYRVHEQVGRGSQGGGLRPALEVWR